MAEGINAKKTKKDLYANTAYGSLVQTAINTLVFSQIQFAVGMFQGVAILLHRILWWPPAGTMREIMAATDDISFALTTSNRLSGIIDVSEPAVLCARRLVGIGIPVAVTDLPLISDFTMLPQGGKLIPANPIYLAMVTAGFAGVATIRCTLEFTFLELSATDYLELIQAQYPANVA